MRLTDEYGGVHGYDRRFGLVHVDYAAQQRTINPLAPRPPR
ncbi:family 1 glycosylhydrolase [Streptomyces lincolnensis]|nr:family 1 glycosylhydrolase [Streptomyces lincolnensis]QMV10836.1 family 1 glycosylhydrolase [Streptomyces lincolnensis]